MKIPCCAVREQILLGFIAEPEAMEARARQGSRRRPQTGAGSRKRKRMRHDNNSE
jgi:hypothetical protein